MVDVKLLKVFSSDCYSIHVALILASTPSRDRHYTLRVKKTYTAIDRRNIECQTFEINEISTVIELLNEALEYVRETDPAGPKICNGKTN